MAVQMITRDAVKRRIDEGSAVVVEALPVSYFNDGHLPGALNLPHEEVDSLAPSLLPDKATAVIVYCASLPCANSGVAAERLVELGYENVFEYAEGKEDWVGAGLPTETSTVAA